MIDDGYRSLDHAIEILRGCVAPYSGEQAQKVAVVLKQWHDTIKTLKAEVERLRAAILPRDEARVAMRDALEEFDRRPCSPLDDKVLLAILDDRGVTLAKKEAQP